MFLVITSSIFLQSCREDIGEPPLSTPAERGSIVSIEFLGEVSKTTLAYYLNQSGYTGTIQPQYDVILQKVIYNTVDWNGNIVQVSGLIAYPSGVNNLPLIATFHGTQTRRDNVGSRSPYYSIESVVAASLGYASCAPDYLGLGDSDLIQAYHNESTSASCAIDCIRAARTFYDNQGLTLDGDLFLAGYSQGGYVAMATQKEIEADYSNEFHLTAVAAMAGAFDLYGTMENILSHETYEKPSFLLLLSYGYNTIYGMNELDSIFNEPYVSEIPQLLDGTKTTDDIDASLPTQLNELFKQQFITSMLNGTETKFSGELKANTLLDWKPVAPILLAQGDADQLVPYQNAVTAYNKLRQNGAARVDLFTINGGNHYSSAIPAYEHAIIWFSSFMQNSPSTKTVAVLNK